MLDLFAESQEPFMARAWKRRREDKDKAAEAGAAKHKPFSKIDLTSIILDKGLLTKAAVMRYAQDHGTAAMQVYVHQQQRRLTEHLQDAMEWAAAREVAVLRSPPINMTPGNRRRARRGARRRVVR